MSPWPFIRILLMPVMVVVGYWLGGWCNFIVPAICFIIHPLLNVFLLQKPIIREHHHHQAKNYPAIIFRLTALLYVPVITGLNTWAIYIIATSEFNLIEFIGLALSVGTVNGEIGFTLAHEFIHRNNTIEKTVGYLLLLVNLYMHYGIEHVWGHHVYACTEKDPHTAKIGESLYAFLPRAVKCTFLNAWEIEIKRLKRSKKIIVGFNNYMLLFILLQSLVILSIYLLGGLKSTIFFLLVCFMAALLLHVVNYLQHYGLLRKVSAASGKIEKMTAHHSWKSGKHLQGLNFFQLENHADHHIHPSHRYEDLKTLSDSPQHPTGYSGMIVLAFIPPLWFHIIDKKLLSYK